MERSIAIAWCEGKHPAKAVDGGPSRLVDMSDSEAKGDPMRFGPTIAGSALLLGGLGAPVAASAPTEELSGSLSIVGSTSRTGEGSFLAVAVEAFQAAHPDVEVTLEGAEIDHLSQTLPAQINAGQAPDIISTVTGYGLPIGALSLARNDLLVDLSGEEWASRISSRIVEQISLDGGIYSLPTDMLMVGLHYDPAVFETEGLVVPQTFAELLDLCHTAVERGAVAISLAAGEPFVHQGFLGLGILGSELDADDPNFTEHLIGGEATFAESSGWLRSLEKVGELSEAGCFGENPLAVTREAAEESFATGAAYMMGSYSLGQRRVEPLNPDAQFRLAPFPADDAQDSRVPMGPVVGLVIPQSGDNIDLAKAFLAFAADHSQEYAEQSGGATVAVVVEDPDAPPPLPDYLADLQPLIDEGRTTIIYSDAWPYLDVVAAWDEGFAGVIQGSRNPADVLADMDSLWDEAS